MAEQNISYIAGTPVVIDTITIPSVISLPLAVDSYDGQLCVLSSLDATIKGLYVYNVNKWEVLATSSRVNKDIDVARTKIIMLQNNFDLGISTQATIGLPWTSEKFIDVSAFTHNPTNSTRPISDILFKGAGMYKVSYMLDVLSNKKDNSIEVQPTLSGVNIPNTKTIYKVESDDDSSSGPMSVYMSFVLPTVAKGDIFSIQVKAKLKRRSYISIGQTSYLLIEKIFTGA